MLAISKKRITEIGKYLERCMLVHRNVEHNSKWTTEEKMIVELYDDYLELRMIYQNTINHLYKIGKNELAEYLETQILKGSDE
jgi:hypothetical protein